MDDMKSGFFVNISYNRTLEQLFPLEESAALGPTIFMPSPRLKMPSFTPTSFLLRRSAKSSFSRLVCLKDVLGEKGANANNGLYKGQHLLKILKHILE